METRPPQPPGSTHSREGRIVRHHWPASCRKLGNVQTCFGQNKLAQTRLDAITRAAKEERSWKSNPTPACCVCGIKYPMGLHLAFYTYDQSRYIARFRPSLKRQGYPRLSTSRSPFLFPDSICVKYAIGITACSLTTRIYLATTRGK